MRPLIHDGSDLLWVTGNWEATNAKGDRCLIKTDCPSLSFLFANIFNISELIAHHGGRVSSSLVVSSQSYGSILCSP